MPGLGWLPGRPRQLRCGSCPQRAPMWCARQVDPAGTEGEDGPHWAFSTCLLDGISEVFPQSHSKTHRLPAQFPVERREARGDVEE